jgi:hypothetical protein
VLERGDPKTELVGQTDHHQNLVLPVRVAVDQTLAVQDLDKGVQLQVAARREGQFAVAVRLLLAAVFAGLKELVAIVFSTPRRVAG